jgi:carboxymethylenebutenolidase
MTLLEETADIQTPTGPMRAAIFRPAAPGRYPALVLYSEIFQLTGPVRRLAAQFAGAGFIVAAPEIYHEYEAAGTVLSYEKEGSERGNALKTIKPLAAFDSDVRAALDFLKSHEASTGKLGAVGLCIGGHLAFRAAMQPDCLAATCFYATDIHKRGLGEGAHDDSLDRLKEIAGELLMVYGRQDPHNPREARRIVHEALDDADVLFAWHEFNGAHAFLRDEGPRYNPSHARICMDMALELFGRRLHEGDVAEAKSDEKFNY